MRILVVTDQWYPDYAGGAARVATETARGLAGNGHEVVAIVPRVDGRPAHEKDGSLTVRRAIGRNFVPKTFGDPVATVRSIRALGDSFDLVLGHQSTVAYGASLVLRDVPLAYVYHASAAREMRFAAPRLPIGKRLAFHALAPIVGSAEKRVARAASSVLTLSRFSRDLFAEDHPIEANRVRDVRGGVDVQAFVPAEDREADRTALGVPSDVRLLLTTRRLEPRMGIEQLLEALRVLPEDVVLAVVGTGPLEVALRRLGTTLGLDARVRFAGRVQDEELLRWYRAADLFVLPTLAYEGFGMATLEALASGTPVVGTRVGATPELLEPLESDLLTDATDGPSLASGIERGLALVGQSFRERCRAYAADHFAWERVLPDWEAALVDAAGR
jgi:glycosyltransferase involved in cell wall biosynthesis